MPRTKNRQKKMRGGNVPIQEPVKPTISTKSMKGAAMQWFTISKWLMLAKMFFLIGIIIFLITTFSGAKGGMIASYSWMTIGVFVTMYMVSMMVSMDLGKDSSILDIIKSIAPLLAPGGFLLLPLAFLIFIFYRLGPIINKDASHLPYVFYQINFAAFFFIVIQAYLLIKFYGDEMKSMMNGTVNTKKWIYIPGLILTSVITGAISVQLYVIINSFLTDG